MSHYILHYSTSELSHRKHPARVKYFKFETELNTTFSGTSLPPKKVKWYFIKYCVNHPDVLRMRVKYS